MFADQILKLMLLIAILCLVDINNRMWKTKLSCDIIVTSLTQYWVFLQCSFILMRRRGKDSNVEI